jgi:hypothetical protein
VAPGHEAKWEAALEWLLTPGDPTGGPAEAGVRYLALRDLLEVPAHDPELLAAQAAAHRQGPIAAILAEMIEPGYWEQPGPGYRPKYRSTVWAILTLAQLGAAAHLDERIGRACAYLLDQALAPGGQFGIEGSPSTTVDCLQGNLCEALLALGYPAAGADDLRLAAAVDWMARTVTGEGIAPTTEREAAVRYYAGKCGPLFACGANNKLPCAWGAVKVLLALGRLPAAGRTPLVERAIQQGAEFLLGTDPARAEYPTGYSARPSGNWWKFGFPVFYVTDLLQNVEALVRLGYGRDARLANALELIRAKQDGQGRWLLEYSYAGKTWVDFGAKGGPTSG